MMNNNDLRVIKTKNALKNSMLELIQHKEIEKISVIDICSLALVNRATFYTHFEDKYELLDYCIESFFNPFLQEDITPHTIDGFKQYHMNVVRDILTHVEQNKKTYRVLLKKNRHLEKIMREKVRERMYDKCVKCQEFNLKLNVPINILSEFYAGACTYIVINWIIQDGNESADDIAEYIQKLTI